MVKRLSGFVMLLAVVALLLQWASLRESEPEREKEVEVEVAAVSQDPVKETPAPEPAPSTPPVAQQQPSPAPVEETPASVEEPSESSRVTVEQVPDTPSVAGAPPAEPGPSSAPADERRSSESPVAESEAPSSESSVPRAAAVTEQEPPVSEQESPESERESPASEEAIPPPELEPSASSEAEPAPPVRRADERAARAESGSSSAPAAESAQSASAGAEAEAQGSSAPSEEGVVEERMISDEEFIAVERAQGRTDERTDAQRRHQSRDGWYGWGVLADYADPDRAARLLGGAAVVQGPGGFFTLRESRGGQVRARPVANVSAAYGSIALRGHGGAFRQRLRSALSTGALLGREADYKLWYLFPRREAVHLGNKVVAVFECHVRETGLSGEAAERFRKESKLRGAVLALGRANGGRLGIYLPRYFQTVEGRARVADACRALDEESRRFGS